jgi:hypothetical protein
MALNLRWVGEADLDRVAQTRWGCYSAAAKEREQFKEGIRADARAKPGDFVLAESGGRALGTATSMSLAMWVRGGRIPVQGVAYVGTARTARRSGGSEKGVATQIMQAVLAKAREREEVASALMPFRASFYEHFGYGLAERRNDWIVPLSIMPAGNVEGFDYAEAGDRQAIVAVRQQAVERGQCDIETSAAGWANRHRQYENGFEIVDRTGGAVCGWAYLTKEVREGQTLLRVAAHECAGLAGLLRLLQFLGSQRDQHPAAWITLPADIALNRLLRDVQLPHRPVTHAVAECHPFTRMQLRVLDHKRFLGAMRVDENWRGRAEVAVLETEGTVSRFGVEIDGGRIEVKPGTGSADIECSDSVWASIASGDLPIGQAERMGIVRVNKAAAFDPLRCLAEGPVPFCEEYF